MLTAARPANVLIIPPGPMGGWTHRLVVRLAKVASIPVRIVDRNEDVTQHADGSTLLVSQFPNRFLVDAITDGRLDPVLLMCEPARTAAYLLQTGMTLLQAAGQLTGSMVAHPAVGATSRSRLVYASLDEPASITSRATAQALGLPHDPMPLKATTAQPDTLAAAVAGAGPEPPPLSPEQQRIIEMVTGSLVDLAEGRRGRPLIWPTDIFFWGDRPNEPAPRIASVVGPSRTVIYGPYLHFPPGRWSAELILAFSGAIEDIPFLLEVYGGPDCLGRFRIEGRPAGGYRGRLTFDVVDPIKPVEIRLRNEQGSIDGAIALVEMRLKPEEVEAEFLQLGQPASR